MGQVNANKVENIKKGDILVWNYGYTSKVKSVEKSESGKSYNVTTISSISGEEFTRTYRQGRMIGIGEREVKNEKERMINTIRSKIRK